MRKIYVDFNTMMSEPVDLVKLGTRQLLESSPFHEGERVILFDEEMEVEATVHYSTSYHYWLAGPDWTTRVDLLPAAPQQDTHLPL